MKFSENRQLVCIYIDDSGKLVNTEHVAIYAGLVFTSKNQKDKFITQYRSIISQMKCHYCDKLPETCNHVHCPELKHHNLKPKHVRQLINYIKKYSVLSCVINNNKVYSNIKNNAASRGRFLDYSLKLLIKKTMKGLIEEEKINPYQSIRLVINIDEQTTKSNGYYNLADSIIEELKYGISNYNYSSIYAPILHADLEVKLQYQKSEKSYLIQAADLVAGTIRRTYLTHLDNFEEFQSRTKFVNYKIFLP